MSTSVEKSYHHKDLRSTLIESGKHILAEGRTFSLRAVAADAGVSPTATYRHFKDRQALESALAAEGYSNLLVHLQKASGNISSREDLWKVAAAYADWALNNEAIFHIMFTTECDPNAPERVQAVDNIKSFLASELTHWYGSNATPALMTATWSLVHGLTVLHLEGKFPTLDVEAMHQRICAAWKAIYPAE